MASKDTTKKSSGTGGEGGKPDPAAPYVVLARKYRPASFEDLIGQSAMVTTLKNAFASGRIAQGYMLTGVRGVGKTTTARILARGLNYEPDGPTTELPALGPHCAQIMESRHPDVIEMDAASNTGVDNIREIIESARYKPMVARYKVFIIDEVHMLSKGAFNALLKTLEEPPEHVKFIFATTEIRKVPVTVLSRCQRFDLRRVDVPELTAHFQGIVEKEAATAADDALALIARAAGGSVRDGLSILDQAIAMGQGRVTEDAVREMLGLADRGRLFDLLELVFGGKSGPALESFATLMRDGADPAQLMADLAEAVHLATRIRAVGGEAGMEGLSAEERRRAGHLAQSLSVPLLSRAWQMLLKGIEEVTRAPNPAAAAEMLLIRMCYTADLPSPDEIIRTFGGANVPVRRGGSAGDDASDKSQNQESQASIVSRQAGSFPKPEPTQANPREQQPPRTSQHALEPDEFEGDDGFPERFDEEGASSGENYDVDEEGVQSRPHLQGLADPQSFTGIVALAKQHREARLTMHLEDNVSLVKFDRVAGSIDLFLLPGAPKEIANELREKLNRWTGRRWVVVVSPKMGERTLGEVKREQHDAEIKALKTHPAVKAVLDAFPDASIEEVRRIAREDGDDSATGS
ncbi:MAG: DNA polymerase III subunit gamma/tau [Hyphomicrobiaceae bacterium]|nr:DNA polymerase III subunit gamma/tau [Hyphomicrobiaceae bacterium]MCC0008909.1 DNA polymerase III subunit gamma/tau [Hyphomicrobiaceae bacterium]